MNGQVSSPVSRLDRISALPDEIVCTILSNLPVEESARTSILSKRWCKIWLVSPIVVSDESIIKQSSTYSTQERSSYSSWIINTLFHIISIHPGPIHTCHFILPIWDDHPQTLLKLLRTLTLKGIQNLKIYGNSCVFDIPCFVMECESLVDVDFRSLAMSYQSRPCTEIFPNLRKLTLSGCNVSFPRLFSSKSIIELNMHCIGDEEVVIESHSLKKFSFSNEEYTKLIVKDVPNLESLSCDDVRNSEVVILHAPKLKVLSCIDMHIWMLQLGSYQLKFRDKYMKISGEITYMPSVRSLNIMVYINNGHEEKSVPHLLKCFPALEILELKIIDNDDDSSSNSDCSFSDDEYDDKDNNDDIVVVYDDDDDDYANYVHLISDVNCLNHHLKVLRVENYSGRQSHLDFANLIIAKARVLETVILVYGNDFEDKWIEAQKQFLMQNGASKMLRIEFVKHSGI